MEADSQVCQNCKRNVASAHCTLHGAHCLSFLVICPECEEPVPRSKMKEHVDTVHQQAKKIQQHPGQCKFCDLAVHFNKLDVHEFHCGSRTEHCPHCNQPIVLRVLAQHKAVCLSAKAKPEEGKGNVSPGRTQCDSCKQMIPENKYVSHMVTGNQASSAKKDVRPKTKTRNSARKQETKDQNGTVDLPLKSAVQQRAALPTGDEAAAYDILRRCPQCGILLPLPILNPHQEKCLRLAQRKKNN
ncbi:XIAP-associated factor 1 isoform X2 [Microtus ochrogaster]|uniref:XIAP-associated factor 1 isoform X2 n=1 Tax=Microtus ochrogaster TaxID=79684 RepID=A0ABM1U1Q0_MICOH|nr:XIAP-associated factor 1 isoform X2 [Microtus ochrogaster]